MSDENQSITNAGEFTGASRVVDAGRPIEWFRQGWTTFLKAPGLWIGMTVFPMVVIFILGMVPIIGHLVLNLAMPVLGAGLLLGCRSLRQGGELRFDHLFAGFKQNTGNLVMVGVYYTIGMLIVLAVTFLIGGGAALTGHGMGIAAGGFLLALLVMLLFMVPLTMAIWFAPALVVFHDMAPIPAMKASFVASLKNIQPFLIYGVIVLVLGVAASLPIFLGWLVLGPMLVGAHYASYLDIFE